MEAHESRGMEQRGTDDARRRQALLAEMLGIMAGLGSPQGSDTPQADAGEGLLARPPKERGGQEWFSVQDACDYVHVSRTTLYRLIREGKLPSHRIRGRILINRETLDACIRDGLLA